jgi:hypothetical protein
MSLYGTSSQSCGTRRLLCACNQRTAMRFIDKVRQRLPFRIHVVQTDNGAVWAGRPLRAAGGKNESWTVSGVLGIYSRSLAPRR